MNPSGFGSKAAQHRMFREFGALLALLGFQRIGERNDRSVDPFVLVIYSEQHFSVHGIVDKYPDRTTD